MASAEEKPGAVANERGDVLEVPQKNGRVALMLRIAAAIACPPLLVFANLMAGANLLYAVALAYVPVAAGWIGLISRPVLDAAMGRDGPRYEFSGKGAMLASVLVFFVLLVFAPRHADRSTLTALFFASSLLFYGIGKCGCLFLGCCRALDVRAAAPPLPAIEAACAFALCAAALLGVAASHGARVYLFAAIVAGLFALRVYSRVARGARVLASLVQLDSLLLAALLACTIAAAIIPIGLSR